MLGNVAVKSYYREKYRTPELRKKRIALELMRLNWLSRSCQARSNAFLRVGDRFHLNDEQDRGIDGDYYTLTVQHNAGDRTHIAELLAGSEEATEKCKAEQAQRETPFARSSKR